MHLDSLTPRLSVIIASYNSGSYIRQCLDSILNQTYKDLEIIISDDASSDDTPALISDYKRRYPELFTIIRREQNAGPGKTRHEAALKARGTFITTLDSDDYYYRADKLEREMTLAESYFHQGNRNAIVFSDIAMIRSDGVLITLMSRRQQVREGNLLLDILTRRCLIPRDFIMPRSLYFAVGGYRSDIYTHEDWDLKIRLATTASFHYTGIEGVAYRRNPTGLSSTAYPIRTNNMWRVFTGSIGSAPSEHRIFALNHFMEHMRQRDQAYLSSYNPDFVGLPWLQLRKMLLKLQLYWIHNRWSRRALASAHQSETTPVVHPPNESPDNS